MKFWIIVGAATWLVGCGDGKRGIGTGDVTTPDTVDTKDTASGETAATTSDNGSDGDATPSDGDTAQAALPNACDEQDACRSGVCRSGVCVVDPPAAAVSHITNPVDNVESDQWPNLACADETVAPPTQSETATLYGAVARFGKGRKTIGIDVAVFLADGFDPSACNTGDADAKKACFRGYGTPIGAMVSISATPSSVPSECAHHEDCPLGYQCFDPNALGGQCSEEFGVYEIANVPLDTPLVIRSYATTSEAQWHDTYVFNVVLHADHVHDGKVQYDAQMVSEGQWILTSNTVGLPPMLPENGAVGGRVRDCGATGHADDWPIADVRLGLAQPGQSFVYFNDLEDDTVPLIDRETTDILGRFAALDVPAGWNRIAGAASVDGQVVTVGSVPVYVAPSSLSIVSWPGTQPYWRQTE